MRIDRVVRDDVDFENDYLPAHQYLIPYLIHVGHKNVTQHTLMNKQNISKFLHRYVKPWLAQQERAGMVQMVGVGNAAQIALNGRGWRELMKSCRVEITQGVLKLYKNDHI